MFPCIVTKIQLGNAPKETWYIMLQHSECDIDIFPRTDHSKVPFHILLGTCDGSGYVEGSNARGKALRTGVLGRVVTYLHKSALPQKNRL